MNKEFKEIFEGLNSAYGQYIPSNVYSVNGKQKGRPFTIKKPVTEELWIKHLDGKEPALGIIPINEKNLCRWGCIDVDRYDLDHRTFWDASYDALNPGAREPLGKSGKH